MKTPKEQALEILDKYRQSYNSMNAKMMASNDINTKINAYLEIYKELGDKIMHLNNVYKEIVDHDS